MKRATTNKLRGRWRGISLVYVIVGSLVFLGIASFAVDLAKIYLVRMQLRVAVDAASLAGCSQFQNGPTAVRTAAKNIALQNMVDGHGLALLDTDIQFGTWNANGRAFNPLTGANEVNANALRITGVLNSTRSTGVS